jgi:hypothetical protein
MVVCVGMPLTHESAVHARPSSRLYAIAAEAESSPPPCPGTKYREISDDSVIGPPALPPPVHDVSGSASKSDAFPAVVRLYVHVTLALWNASVTAIVLPEGGFGATTREMLTLAGMSSCVLVLRLYVVAGASVYARSEIPPHDPASGLAVEPVGPSS